MSKRQHTHKYQRRKLGKNKDYIVYACVLPGCNHYISADLVVGKLSVCNRCDKNVFVITKDMVLPGREVLKPHCIECTKFRKDKPTLPEEVLDNFLENFLKIGKETEDGN